MRGWRNGPPFRSFKWLVIRGVREPCITKLRKTYWPSFIQRLVIMTGWSSNPKNNRSKHAFWDEIINFCETCFFFWGGGRWWFPTGVQWSSRAFGRLNCLFGESILARDAWKNRFISGWDERSDQRRPPRMFEGFGKGFRGFCLVSF